MTTKPLLSTQGNPPIAQFNTLTGDDWRMSLERARQRRSQMVVRQGHQIAEHNQKRLELAEGGSPSLVQS